MKSVMFVVTHVLAIDGYSRKIDCFVTIPPKMQHLCMIYSSNPYYVLKAYGIKSI